MLNKMLTYKNKNSDMFFYLLGLISVAISALFIHKIFFFKNNYFGFTDIGSDTILNNAAYYKYMAHRFFNGDFSMYSFESGIGTNLYAVACLIFDVFNLPFYFLGENSVYPSLIYISSIKLFTIYSISFLFFKFYKLDYKIILIGSFLMTFNGFTMAWGQHYFFLTGFVYTILLLYSFERMYVTGKWLLFVLITAIFFAFSYYLLFTSGLFLILYFFIKLSLFEKSPSFFKTKKNVFGCFVLFGLLGLALSSFFSLPALYHVASSSRITTSYFPFVPHMTISEVLTFFYRIFSNDSLGVGSSFVGYPNYYEAPNIYTTALLLVLSPLVFFNYFRKKPLYTIATISLFCTLIYSNLISALTNGFSTLYTRWSYIISIAFIFFIVFGLSDFIKNKTFNKRNFFCLILIIYGLYFSLPFIFPDIFIWNLKTLFFVGIFSVFFSTMFIALFFLYQDKKIQKSTFLNFLMIFIGIELVLSYSHSISKRSVFSKNFKSELSVMNDLFPDTVFAIKKLDTGNFRIASDRFNLLVEPIMYNYLGLTAYCSLNDPEYLKMLEMSEPGHSTVTLKGPIKNANFASLLGAKYFISTSDGSKLWSGYIKKELNAPYAVSLNENYFPLVHFIKNKTADQYKLIVENSVEAEQLVKLLSADSRKNAATFSGFSNSQVTAHINAESDGLLFFSLPYSESWKAVLNDQKTLPIQIAHGFTAIKIKKGLARAVLTFEPKGFKIGLWISLLTLILILILLFTDSIFKKSINKS